MSIEKNIESMLSELRTISSMIYTVYQVAREVPTGTAPASAAPASTASADPDALMVQARAICQGLVRSNQGDIIKKTLGTFKASKVTDLGPTDLELFIRELSK